MMENNSNQHSKSEDIQVMVITIFLFATFIFGIIGALKLINVKNSHSQKVINEQKSQLSIKNKLTIKELKFSMKEGPSMSGVISNNSDKNLKEVILDCEAKTKSDKNVNSFFIVISQRFPAQQTLPFERIPVKYWYPIEVLDGDTSKEILINPSDIPVINCRIGHFIL